MESARLITQRSQSLLLTAWLATRLGWEFQRAESRGENMPRALYFQSDGHEVKVERVLRKMEGSGTGACFSFVIEADPARFSFSRGPDGKVALLRGSQATGFRRVDGLSVFPERWLYTRWATNPSCRPCLHHEGPGGGDKGRSIPAFPDLGPRLSLDPTPIPTEPPVATPMPPPMA